MYIKHQKPRIALFPSFTQYRTDKFTEYTCYLPKDLVKYNFRIYEKIVTKNCLFSIYFATYYKKEIHIDVGPNHCPLKELALDIPDIMIVIEKP